MNYLKPYLQFKLCNITTPNFLDTTVRTRRNNFNLITFRTLIIYTITSLMKFYYSIIQFLFFTIRCFDFPKLYSSKVFVFIVQARYWLALFMDIG